MPAFTKVVGFVVTPSQSPCDRYFLISLHERKAPPQLSDIETKFKQMQQKEDIQNQLTEFYRGDLYRQGK